MSPAFEAGNVILPHSTIAPWVQDYIEELCSVPAAEHWDQADATSQALDRLMHGPKKQPLMIYGFHWPESMWTPFYLQRGGLF